MTTTTKTTETPTRVSPRYTSPIRTADGQILPTLGPKICRFIEANLVYGEGDWFGQPVRLRPFQREFFYRLYEYRPGPRRLRRYKRAVLGMAKGNGKTPIAAWTGAVELTAGLKRSPRVIAAASSLKQADLVFGDLKTAVEKSPTLGPLVEAFDLEVQLRGQPGVAERVAAVLGANDGPRATQLLADELHEWKGRLGRVFRVLDGAIAKRENASTLVSSTAAVDDPDLVMNELYDYGVRVATGEVVDDAFLFVWYEADPALNLDDQREWLEAVRQANPAAGDFCSIENIRARFDGAQRIPRNEFRRYHLNQRTKAEDTWEVAEWWDSFADRKIKLDRKLPITVAVDVGIRHDSSAVVAAQVQRRRRLVEGHRIMVEMVVIRLVKGWENPYPVDHPMHDEWLFNLHLVEEELRELKETFPAVAREVAGPAFFYDKWFFETQAFDLELEGLNMIDFPQTDARMIPASTTFFQLAAEHRIVHDGDPMLSRHIKAVVPHVKPRGWRISKPRGARIHIDAAVAAAMAAYEVTRPPEEEPPPTPHVY